MFGVVKWMCFEYKLPFLSVEQSRLKKYATGNGKAEKSDMVLRAYTEFSLSLSSDECDAFWIAHLGLTSLTMDGLAFRVTSVAEMLKKRKGG
jgi:Holliday junction resolvasome RuvABC endonuclease subunit